MWTRPLAMVLAGGRSAARPDSGRRAEERGDSLQRTGGVEAVLDPLVVGVAEREDVARTDVPSERTTGRADLSATVTKIGIVPYSYRWWNAASRPTLPRLATKTEANSEIVRDEARGQQVAPVEPAHQACAEPQQRGRQLEEGLHLALGGRSRARMRTPRIRPRSAIANASSASAGRNSILAVKIGASRSSARLGAEREPDAASGRRDGCRRRTD